jgi:hypothetical protein
MMKKTRKFLLAGILSACAALIATTSVLAIFTSTAKQGQNGTTGNLNIGVTDVNIKEGNTIAPGDNDLSISESTTQSEDHTLSFTVKNKGNKSVRTRHIFTIRPKDTEDGNNNTLNAQLDPQKIFLTNGKKELSQKYYKLSDGKYYSQSNYLKIKQSNSSLKCTEIKYIVISDIFNGAGLTGEKEKTALPSNSQTYIYHIGMSPDTDWTYMNQPFNISIDIQAIQVRNSTGTDWTTVYTDDKLVQNKDVK